MFKKIAVGFLLLFVGLQFFQPKKSGSAPLPDENDFLVRYEPPPTIRRMLTEGCYDCHSNQTRYPWYVGIQPAGWWLVRHIEEGKAALNLSEFGALSDRRKASKLESMYDEITDRHMPLRSYTLAHPSAKLSDDQIKLLCSWIESVENSLPVID